MLSVISNRLWGVVCGEWALLFLFMDYPMEKPIIVFSCLDPVDLAPFWGWVRKFNRKDL